MYLLFWFPSPRVSDRLFLAKGASPGTHLGVCHLTELTPGGPGTTPVAPPAHRVGWSRLERPTRTILVAVIITGLIAVCVGGYYLSWNSWAPLAPGVYPGRMFYYMGGTTYQELRLMLLWVKRQPFETRPPAVVGLELLDAEGNVIVSRPLAFRPECSTSVSRRGELLVVEFEYLRGTNLPAATIRFARIQLQGEPARTYDIGTIRLDPAPDREWLPHELYLRSFASFSGDGFTVSLGNSGDEALTITSVALPMPGLAPDILEHSGPVVKWLPQGHSMDIWSDPDARTIEWGLPLRLEPHSDTEIRFALPPDVMADLADSFWYFAPTFRFRAEGGEYEVRHLGGWAGPAFGKGAWRRFSTQLRGEGQR